MTTGRPSIWRWTATSAGSAPGIILRGVIVDLALAVAPAVFGIAVWRRHGASWRAVVSWAIPVTVVLIAGLVYAEGAARIAMVLAGAALFATMMLSSRAAIWWERNVSRTVR